jgi:hypothetical protein
VRDAARRVCLPAPVLRARLQAARSILEARSRSAKFAGQFVIVHKQTGSERRYCAAVEAYEDGEFGVLLLPDDVGVESVAETVAHLSAQAGRVLRVRQNLDLLQIGYDLVRTSTSYPIAKLKDEVFLGCALHGCDAYFKYKPPNVDKHATFLYCCEEHCDDDSKRCPPCLLTNETDHENKHLLEGAPC